MVYAKNDSFAYNLDFRGKNTYNHTVDVKTGYTTSMQSLQEHNVVLMGETTLPVSRVSRQYSVDTNTFIDLVSPINGTKDVTVVKSRMKRVTGVHLTWTIVMSVAGVLSLFLAIFFCYHWRKDGKTQLLKSEQKKKETSFIE